MFSNYVQIRYSYNDRDPPMTELIKFKMNWNNSIYNKYKNNSKHYAVESSYNKQYQKYQS